MSNAPKKNILDRISDLENAFLFVLQENKKLKTNLAAMVELTRAIVKASGDEFGTKVQEIITAHQKEVEVAEQNQQKALMTELVAKGALVTSDSVTEDSILVVNERDAGGNLLSERTQAHFSQFPAEARLALRDQPVGAVIELPGGKLEVVEIYRANPNSKQEA